MVRHISMDVIRDIIQPDKFSSTFSSGEDLSKRGLLFVGSFRKNKFNEGILINQLEPTGQTNWPHHVSSIYVDKLSEQEINKMLSYKFSLPMRHTRELARIVYQKSRGHPLYIVEFLRSIIQNNMMAFSIRERQ